jgi:hypothetical protein
MEERNQWLPENWILDVLRLSRGGFLLAQAGLVWFFTQAVLAIGVPYALLVLPWHMWR